MNLKWWIKQVAGQPRQTISMTFLPENFVFSTFQVIFSKAIFWRKIKSILRYIVEWFNKDLPPAILQPFKIWYVELQGGYP